MKNRLYKVLSVVLSVTMLLSVCFVSGMVNAVAETKGKVRDYYVKGDTGATYTSTDTYGTVGTEAAPYASIYDVIQAVNADTSFDVEGNTFNVWIMQDFAALIANKDKTYKVGSSTYITHNMAYWHKVGTTNTFGTHNAKMVIDAHKDNVIDPEGKTAPKYTYLATSGLVGTNVAMTFGGPTEINNVNIAFMSSSNYNNPNATKLAFNGNDVIIGANVTCSYTPSINSTSSADWDATLKDIEAFAMDIGQATTATYLKPVVINILNVIDGDRQRFYLPSLAKGAVVFKENVTLNLLSSSVDKGRLSISSTNHATLPIFEKDINVKITGENGAWQFNPNGGQAIVKGGIHLIKSGSATNRDASYPWSQIYSTAYTEYTDAENNTPISKHWIVTTEKGADADIDLIDFYGETGKFAIAKGYKATAKNTQTGATQDSENGILDLNKVGSGEYDIKFEEQAEKVWDYYVKAGGTGNGTDENNPAPDVATAIATMNSLDLTAEETANIWIIQGDAPARGELVSSNTKRAYHNQAYWSADGKVEEHDAKIIVKPYSKNASATYLFTGDIVGDQDNLILGGPTEIDGLTVVFPHTNGKSNRGIIVNGKDYIAGANLEYAYIDKDGNHGFEWTSDLSTVNFLSLSLAQASVDGSFDKPFAITLNHQLNYAGSSIQIPSTYDGTYTFDDNVTINLSEGTNLGYISTGTIKNTSDITFKKNINIKVNGGTLRFNNASTPATMKIGGGLQFITTDKTKIGQTTVSDEGKETDHNFHQMTDYCLNEDGTAPASVWVIKTADADLEYVNFQGETGKFTATKDGLKAIATKVVAEGEITPDPIEAIDGVLDLSDAPGEYTISFVGDFTMKPLDKGYFTLVFDDGRMPITEQAAEIFEEFDMPLSVAIPAINVESGNDLYNTLVKIQDNGGEILSHGYNHIAIIDKTHPNYENMTNNSGKGVSTPEEIEYELGESWRKLNKLGFNVNGMIEVGCGGAEGSADYELVESIARKYYKYSNASGVSPQYTIKRRSTSWYTMESLKNSIDKLATNKTWLVLYAHNFSEITSDAATYDGAILREVLQYIKDKNGAVEVVTYNQMYNKFGNYTGPQVPTKEALDSLRPAFTKDFYVGFGGTGDGTNKDNPAPNISTVINTINTNGFTAKDTANIWIMQNDMTDITCTSNRTHNMAYWGSTVEHAATIKINAYEGNTYSGDVITNTLLSVANTINSQGNITFGGPTVIGNVQLVYNSASGFNAESKYILNFNGRDVTISADAKFAYINANGDTTNDEGEAYKNAGWPSTVTKHFKETSFFNAWVTSNTGDAVTYPNPINITLNRGFSTTSDTSRLLVGASNDIFNEDVNIILDAKSKGYNARVRLGYSSYGATFNKNLNFKLISADTFGFDPKANITVNGAIQLILSDKATFYKDNPYTNFDDKAFKSDGSAADSWIIKVPEDNVNSINFISGEKGKFEINPDFTAVATNITTKETIKSENGILDLSDVCGEYKVNFIYSKIENETHNYDHVINYRGYNNNLTKFNGALANTYKKLTSDSEVNVVYMGGNVLNDANHLFKEKINTWLNNNFGKNTTINFIDKTFEGSGTTFGSLRVARDVVSKLPDLVILEYSLNDYLENITAKESSIKFETIVREIKTTYPDCDIVSLFASTTEIGDELYPQMSAQEEICEKYDITSINLGSVEEEYLSIIKEFLVNTLIHGEYGDSYEITNQVLPMMVNKYLFDGNTDFIFPVDVDFTTAGGTSYDDEAQGFGISDYVGVITVPKNSNDTLTVNFEGTELYMLVNKGYNSENTYKISLDGGKTFETKNYSGNIITNVASGLVSGKHTVIIETASDAQIGVCGFYSRDIEKVTNNLNICDLVYLNETNTTDDMLDYNKDQSVNASDISALKKILLGESMKPEINSTKHIKPIARLGWRPYTGDLPEQSLLAYQKAYDTGHRILLCDVRITSDGYMVCCHDNDISKVHAYDSNGEAVKAGTVKISETTLNDLLTYDFGMYKGYSELKVLQIEDFLNFCKERRDVTPVLEMKVEVGEQKVAELVSLIKEYGFENNIMFVDSGEQAQLIGTALPNCTIGDWVYTLTDGVIANVEKYPCKGKFIYVARDGGNEDSINFENYVKCKAKGIDIGFTYIPSTYRDYFNDLKNRGIFNYCKYIALDEVSWLYE